MDKNPSPNSPPKNQSKNRATKIKLTLDQEQKFHLYTPKITTLHCRNRHPSTQKKNHPTPPLTTQPQIAPQKGEQKQEILRSLPAVRAINPPTPHYQTISLTLSSSAQSLALPNPNFSSSTLQLRFFFLFCCEFFFSLLFRFFSSSSCACRRRPRRRANRLNRFAAPGTVATGCSRWAGPTLTAIDRSPWGPREASGPSDRPRSRIARRVCTRGRA